MQTLSKISSFLGVGATENYVGNSDQPLMGTQPTESSSFSFYETNSPGKAVGFEELFVEKPDAPANTNQPKETRLITPDTFNRISGFCLINGVPENVITQILEKQNDLSPEEAMEFSASASCPQLFVTFDAIYVVKGLTGKGAQSSVFHVKKISTTIKEYADKVIKKSKASFAKEAALFSPASRDSRVDHIETFYSIINNSNKIIGHIAVFEKSE